VIIREPEGWRMWVCCHPLADPGQEDRMITRYAASGDGLKWRDQGVVLRGTRGSWEGARRPGNGVLADGSADGPLRRTRHSCREFF
jgi:hypothetical protein